MKIIILFLTAMLCVVEMNAKQFSYNFKSARLSEALSRIADENPALKLNFIYNELDSYTTSATINTDNAYDALRKTIGLNPVSVIKKGDRYYIEALQHGKYEYNGMLVGSDGEPVVSATVLLLSPNDSTVITYGFSDDTGKFRIPCDRSRVIGKFTCMGYKTVERNLANIAVGTIVMNEKVIQLK